MPLPTAINNVNAESRRIKESSNRFETQQENPFLPECARSGGETKIVFKLLKSNAEMDSARENLWSSVRGAPQVSRRGEARAAAPPFPSGRCMAV